MSENTNTPAGWYPDPGAPGMMRWWDGSAWADMIIPEALAPQQPSVGQRFVAVTGGLASILFGLALLIVAVLFLYLIF